MKYFTNIISYQNLKEQYKKLLKENHPDNGGDAEVMKAINVEYDVLFKIWKDRAATSNNLNEEEKKETAQSTRRHFYTANGWEGSRYNCNLTLKEIAAIVRRYVKEKYPTCKFSIRTSYASMCQELHVAIKEFPAAMYKTAEDLKNEGIYRKITGTDYDGKLFEYERMKEDIELIHRRMVKDDIFKLDSWRDSEWIEAYAKALEKNPHWYGIKTEYFQTVLNDVNSFVKSYNYSDCDGMQDYFDVGFWYFDCKYDECKTVLKTARIKNKSTKPAAQNKKESESLETSGKPYTITESEHTKTHEKIYLVKWLGTLSKTDYISLNKKIKSLGGYYSKFTHSFIFKEDPAELLKSVNA